MGDAEEVKKDKTEIDYEQLFYQCLLAVGSHPLTQARILIQLGHEPSLPFYRSADGAWIPFLGKSGWFYTGVLTGYLRDANLFPSTMDTLAVGMMYKVLETVTSSISQTVAEKPIRSLALEDVVGKAPEGSYKKVFVDSTKDFLVKSAGLVCSRPFYVIAVRQIGSIANATNDLAVLAPLKEVVGDGGLFAGIVPKLAYEALVIYMGNSFIYLYNNHVKSDESDETVQKLLPTLINMAVSTVCYPLHLVSTVQCVQGTQTILDEFPELGWLQILARLRSRKLHTRGHSLLFSRKAEDLNGTPV